MPSSKRLNPTPVVDMGVTVYGYSDRHAGTIIEISDSKKRLKVQYDVATRTDKNGMSEDQDYVYTKNPNGIIDEFSMRKNGHWVRLGESMKTGRRLGLNYRDEYYDYSF